MLALACVVAAVSCEGSDDPAPTARPDPTRVRLLAALPDGALERGVYVFGGDVSEELSPGSLLAPLIGSVIPQADVVVETGAPPVALLAGIGPGIELPEGAVRIGDVIVFGAPGDVDDVRGALGDDGGLEEPLEHLAAASAPVGWAGPLPGCEPGTTVDVSDGVLVVALSTDAVELTVLGSPAGSLADVVEDRLASEAPEHSPGKPWRSILTDYEIDAAEDRVVIEAVPADLPGGLLRQLLDFRSLTFLRPADC